MADDKKKNIMIASVLALCLVIGVFIAAYTENKSKDPKKFYGDINDLDVKITEICSANRTVIKNSKGETADYIELYNAGETFMLTGFGLANKDNGKAKYTFGEIEFRSGEYLVVFLDGDEVPFKLSAKGGETVALVSPNGKPVTEYVKTMQVSRDEVMLYSDGGYYLSYDASPGYLNTAEGVREFLKNRDTSEYSGGNG